MTYTIWHAGTMIGESAFDQQSPTGNPLQRAAIFIPTNYGRTLFPRLSGILTAAAELEEHMEARGLDPERMDPDAIAELMETTEGGRRFIEVGRLLSEVEIRDDHSRPLRFSRIAFIDMNELGTLHRRLAPDDASFDRVPEDAPHLVVSATLEPGSEWPDTAPAGRSRTERPGSRA